MDMNVQTNVNDQMPKIGYTNLSWLLGVYHYDQGKASKEWLAQSMGVETAVVPRQVEAIRQQGFYKNFYAKVSAHMDKQWNVSRTDLLNRMPLTQEGVTHAFQVLSDRQVRPDEVAQSAQGVSLLANPVVGMLLGSHFEHLPQNPLSGWQKLLAESMLLASQQEVRELMSAKAAAGKEDESYPLQVEMALSRQAQLAQNYQSKGNEPLLLPEVQRFMAALDQGREARKEAFQALAENTLAVNQAMEQLLQVESFWSHEQEATHTELLDELMPQLVQTVWFEDYMGTHLEGVDPVCLLAVQVPVAEAYERLLTNEPERMTVEERAQVDQAFSDMEHAISYRLEIAHQVQQVLADNSVDSAHLDRSWMARQESLQEVTRRVGPMTMEDYVQIESYLKDLEQQARDYAESLRLRPDGETLRSYHETLQRIEQLNERVSRRHDPHELKLEKLGLREAGARDRFVRLLYKESTGELAVATKPTLDKAWRVIDYLIKESDAIGYAKAFNRKLTEMGAHQPETAAVERDLCAYQGRGTEAVAYEELAFGRDGQVTRLSPEESERLLKEFEHKKAVDFDLANDGIADVVQTDANRAEYQEKVQRDMGGNRGRGI